jgi:hypothetical protein
MKIAAILTVAGLASIASAQITISPINTPFVDIRTTGTALNTGGTSVNLGDDGEATITASALATAGFTGNPLFPVADVRVGNNGAVIWNASSGEIGFTNANILTMPANSTTSGGNGNGTRQLIAPFWDDVFGSSTNGARNFWQVIGGNLHITWFDQDHFDALGTGRVTFQLVIYSNNGGALADFVYNDTLFTGGTTPASQNDGGSASIGYKNWGGPAWANDLQWSFNTKSVAGYVESEVATRPNALRIIPAPGALALLGLGGIVAGRRSRR